MVGAVKVTMAAVAEVGKVHLVTNHANCRRPGDGVTSVHDSHVWAERDCDHGGSGPLVKMMNVVKVVQMNLWRQRGENGSATAAMKWSQ